MPGWVCQGKPLRIPVGESFQKAYLEEWTHAGDVSSGERGMANVPTLVQDAGYKDDTSKQKLPEPALSAPRSAEQPYALTCEPIGHQGTASFWERTEAPLPLLRPRCNFTTPRSSVFFLNAWSCRFQVKRSVRRRRYCFLGHRTVHRLGKDRPPMLPWYNIWSMSEKATADFREASTRTHYTSSQEYHFDNNVPNRSRVQKRLSIYNWNPVPRRGKEGAF